MFIHYAISQQRNTMEIAQSIPTYQCLQTAWFPLHAYKLSFKRTTVQLYNTRRPQERMLRIQFTRIRLVISETGFVRVTFVASDPFGERQKFPFAPNRRYQKKKKKKKKKKKSGTEDG